MRDGPVWNQGLPVARPGIMTGLILALSRAEFLQDAAAAIIMLSALLLSLTAVAIGLRDRYQKRTTA